MVEHREKSRSTAITCSARAARCDAAETSARSWLAAASASSARASRPSSFFRNVAFNIENFFWRSFAPACASSACCLTSCSCPVASVSCFLVCSSSLRPMPHYQRMSQGHSTTSSGAEDTRRSHAHDIRLACHAGLQHWIPL